MVGFSVFINFCIVMDGIVFNVFKMLNNLLILVLFKIFGYVVLSVSVCGVLILVLILWVINFLIR